MTILVNMIDICVRFDDRRVLDSINLTLNRGEITTIIGPNGAGKSTLIKVLLGLVKPDSGSIEKARKLTIGYVPQKLKLNDTLPLSVDRFLKLAGRYSRQQRNQALALVGAEHLAGSDMHKLSGGENQRVLLARALLRQPSLLVLDEPAQGVDVQGQVELYNLIESIRHHFNCAVLMVSHDLHLVMAKTDKVLCINHHVCCTGAPHTIANDPAYIALFGKQSSDSLAIYHHSHQESHDLSGYPKAASQPEDDTACCAGVHSQQDHAPHQSLVHNESAQDNR